MWKIINKDNDRVLRRISDTSLFVSDRGCEEAQQELQTIYESGQHILCSCHDARMFVRHLSSGAYTLVNHPITGRHDEDCPFYSDISGEISEREWGGEIDGRPILTFCLHHDIKASDSTSTLSSTSETSVSTTKRRKPVSKLYRLFCQLIHDSYNNSHYRGKSHNKMQSFYDLRNAANSIAFGDMTLDRWLFFGSKGFTFARSNLLRARDNDNWRGAGRPHALLIEICDDFEQVDGGFRTNNRFVKTRVIRSGLDTTPAPVLVMSSLVIEGDDVVYHSSLVQPIVADSIWIPVDSNYERQFARMAIEYSDKSSDRKKLSFTKPVHALVTQENIPLLPDFIFKTRNQSGSIERFIVEIMGFDSGEWGEAYAARKEKIVPLMKRCFKPSELFEINGTDRERQIESLLSMTGQHTR